MPDYADQCPDVNHLRVVTAVSPACIATAKRQESAFSIVQWNSEWVQAWEQLPGSGPHLGTAQQLVAV